MTCIACIVMSFIVMAHEMVVPLLALCMSVHIPMAYIVMALISVAYIALCMSVHILMA